MIRINLLEERSRVERYPAIGQIVVRLPGGQLDVTIRKGADFSLETARKVYPLRLLDKLGRVR